MDQSELEKLLSAKYQEGFEVGYDKGYDEGRLLAIDGAYQDGMWDGHSDFINGEGLDIIVSYCERYGKEGPDVLRAMLRTFLEEDLRGS